MVFDAIDNLYRYVQKEDYQHIRFFLEKISADMPEGRYEICGERIFARVMGYRTNEPEKCRIEAHNKYIDIQSAISGAESIDIYPREVLEISENYNATEDVVYFRHSGFPSIHINNFPGYFTLILPREAHSPQQRTGSIEYVKKVVIKVAYDSWGLK